MRSNYKRDLSINRVIVFLGLWGMNVKVPGLNDDNYNWFVGIVVSLVLFGMVFLIVVKRIGLI